MRTAFRVTTACCFCDYTIVTVREEDEGEDAFFARRDAVALRLALHVRHDHPEVRGPFVIERRERDV